MRAKTGIIAALVLIGTVSCALLMAQTPQPTGSSMWKMMDENARTGYILGFTNASEQYQMILRYERNGCGEVSREHISDFLDQNPISHGTVGREETELDRFYKDPENKGVAIGFAMQIVWLKLAGRPQSEIDRQLDSIRKLSAPR